ncbi:MAG: efflux RND transporter periplasmic adaptor subunit [Verrucomicrobiota bacterium]
MIPNLFRSVLAALVCWVVLITMSGCKEKGAVAAGPPTVEFVSIEQKDVPLYRDWVGTLQGNVDATISAQVTGYLLTRVYTEGTFVTNGQVLFQIDPAPFQADLARAKAGLLEAEAHKGKTALDVQRYRPLAATSAISQQELDDAIQADLAADGQVASQRAAVQTAELNLAFTTIRSPVNGIAGLAQAQVGNLVGPSSGPLSTVVQVDPIRAYFSVDQKLVTQIQEQRIAAGAELFDKDESRDRTKLELILASGQVYPEAGMVRFSDNQVNPLTGTVRVVGEFPNRNFLLVPGMFVRVKALVGVATNALVVPQRSVTELQGRYLIAVIDPENKVSIRPVTPGERVGSDWIIQGNVRSGERVVAEGIQKIREGSVVNPVPLGSVPETPGPAAAPVAAAKD